MKLVLLASTSLVLLLTGTGCQTNSKDSVTQAYAENQTRQQIETVSAVSPLNKEFLVEMADARRMDYAEGELAAQRGTTPKVRAYGKKMMVDQKILLEEIQKLAQENNIAIPEKIGVDKQNGLDDLKKYKGKKFDKTFLTMIQRDHERDVKKFESVEAIKGFTNDRQILDYATRRVSLIQSHLDEVRQIK